jgi:uncharacterized protein (TIRG00374 family)
VKEPQALPEDASDVNQVLSGWKLRTALYSVALAALGYLAVSLWAGGESVWSAMKRVGVGGLAVALGLSLVNYGLRVMRWQLYLRAMGHPVPWRPSLRIYVAGFALTTTPGKAGEMLRGVLLKPWGVPYPASFAAFFSERLSDLLAIVLLALVGLSTYPPARPLVVAGAALVVLGMILLTIASFAVWLEARLSGPSRLVRAAHHALAMLRQARRCHTLNLAIRTTALSLVAWFAEAWAFHLVLQLMGIDVSVTFAVFVYAASMLAGALSFMPGGLGSAEAVMVALLLWAGATAPDAAAATVLIRLATLWFAVCLGGTTCILIDEKSRLNRPGFPGGSIT